MQIRSLGYRTDLFMIQWVGEVLDRGRYTVIRTPSNPTHYWGNFLLFADPPGEGDLENWQNLFAREVGVPPETKHRNFGWDTSTRERGEVQPFLDEGYRLEESVVLTTREVHPPPKVNTEAVIRPLQSDADWESVLQCQIACRDDEHELEDYTLFKRRQMANYRAMTDAGLGVWFGAFVHDRLAADMGVFVKEGVGRYQSVGTHPDFRRRGICGTMVHHVGRYALEHMGAEWLVMVADENYHAARIYELVGFRPTEHQISLCKW